MSIVRFRAKGFAQPTVGWLDNDRITPFSADSGVTSIRDLLHLSAGEIEAALNRRGNGDTVGVNDATILAPIDSQEVWAAGVTYRRSRDARMEESTQKDVYDLVYDADRPELFFKATAHRVSDPGVSLAIRGDSTWDVPEPELVLVINRHREVVGFSIGNDMSSRSIEGENPLYLPQAKMYDGCAAIGPMIAHTSEIPDPLGLSIDLVIERDNEEAFRGETSTEQIHRTFEDLVRYLFRGNSFPDGVMLMTGTGIVPPDTFTLADGDIVHITIDGIGTLSNPVRKLEMGA